jgi:hypothetical protein
MRRNINSGNSTKQHPRKAGRALVLLSITALALAASPAALADDRGGPGAPTVQQLTPTAFFVVPKVIQRYASWSD